MLFWHLLLLLKTAFSRRDWLNPLLWSILWLSVIIKSSYISFSVKWELRLGLSWRITFVNDKLYFLLAIVVLITQEKVDIKTLEHISKRYASHVQVIEGSPIDLTTCMGAKIFDASAVYVIPFASWEYVMIHGFSLQLLMWRNKE